MLVTLKELLDEAMVEHKAVGAFNGTTLEAIRGIIQAAEELNSPVILQHAQSHDDIIDLEEIGPVMKYYAERAKVPVALHLDHGSSFERCVQALKLGFTSVMYDASAKSYEENAAETAEIVKVAHSVGASVEAELGHIFTSAVVQGEGGDNSDSTDDYENLDDIYTDPAVAKKFVEETGVDCLAVAFGTTHGVYLTEPKLDLPRVARLREATGIPLVMHGGSGVSDEDYAVAIENGICKVNYYTYMNTAGGKASKEYWSDESKPLFYDSMSLAATEAIKEDVKRAIKVFQKL
jgi:fructose-bisphosphate aldolase class II